MVHGNLKKLFAGLLAAAMVVASMPLSAYAAEGVAIENEMEEGQSSEAVETSEEIAAEELELTTDEAESGNGEQETNIQEESEETGTDENNTDAAPKDIPTDEAQSSLEESVTEALEEEETRTEEEDASKKETDVRVASEFTRDEAVAWVKAQHGKAYSGSYGVQCVDLIVAYYNYLGEQRAWGDAYQYITNTLPDGWSRIEYYDGFVAEPGDIAVWNKNDNVDGAQWGHIGIVVSADKNGFTSAEQNYGSVGHEPCNVNLWRANYSFWVYGKIACVIRPNFKSTPPPVIEMPTPSGIARVIPDGDYQIVTALGSDMDIGIEVPRLPFVSNVVQDGTKSQIRKGIIGSPYDVFTLTYNPSTQYYTIIHKGSGKSLDVDSWNAANGTNILYCDYHGGTNQQWAISNADNNGLYYIQTKFCGKYLDVLGGDTANGTQVQIWESEGKACQQWALIPYAPSTGKTVAEGDYYIAYAGDTSKRMSVNTTASYPNVEIRSARNDESQVFTLKYYDDGTYRIRNKQTGKNLDIEGSGTMGNVGVWDDDAGGNPNGRWQRWVLKPTGASAYNIVSHFNGKYLDVDGGHTTDGTNVQSWEWNGSAAQKWQFIPYEKKPQLNPPTASIASGAEVVQGEILTLSHYNADKIYYTTDGTQPTTLSTQYSEEGIPINKSMTLKAFAVKEGHRDSDVATYTYTVKQNPEMPTPSGVARVIPDGDYQLVSACGFDKDRGIAVPYGAVPNGTESRIGDWILGESCNVFTLKYDESTQYYSIIHRNSRKSLNVDGSYMVNGTKVTYDDYHGGSNQQWAISHADNDGLYYIQTKLCGKYLDVYGSYTYIDKNVQIWESKEKKCQQWALVPYAPSTGKTVAEGDYYIACADDTSKRMSVNANNVEIRSAANDESQMFTLRYYDDGTYSIQPIRHKKTGKILTIDDSGTTNIGIKDGEGTGYYPAGWRQRWVMKPTGDSTYTIVSCVNGKCIELTEDVIADGAGIQAHAWNGSAAQNWKFVSCEKQPELESSTEEESSAKEEKPSDEESSPTKESAATEESSAAEESSATPEDTPAEEDIEDGVKWHYNENKVTYKDLSQAGGKIATNIKAKEYDGMPYKPSVKVTAVESGKTITLTEGTDYRVIYTNNIHAGTGRVIVKGNGIYKGEISKEFEIKKKFIKKLKVVTGSMAAGDTSEPKVYVYDGSTLLKNGSDYMLDGVSADLAASKGKKQIYIMASSTSDYEGFTAATITVYDTNESRIKGIISSPENIKLSQSTYKYTGKACKPTAVVTVDGHTLTEGKDYTIKYQNNTNAGTAFATITGKGGYVGEVVKEFTITAASGGFALKKPIADVTYNGKLQRPKIIVTADGRTLKQNKDYTVSYTNNLHATDKAKVTVRGKGNYADIPTKVFYFTITPCHIQKASIKGGQGSLFLTYAKHTLVENVDYDITYGSTAGKGKISVTIKAKEGSSFTGEITKMVKQ